jgi:hypothetical protein
MEPPQLPSELTDKPPVDVPVADAVEAAELTVAVWESLEV